MQCTKLNEHIVLITGASSGIGQACAEQFAKQGAKLILVARRAERLQSIAADLQARYDTRVFPLPLDIQTSQAIQQGLQQIPQDLQAITILINNAGTVTSDRSFDQMTAFDIDTMVDTNLKGLLHVTQLILPGMLTRQKGHIVNIGSITANFCYRGGSIYAATKHAVKAITKSLRKDLLGTPIRVSQIDPGATRTEIAAIRWDPKRAESYYANFTPLEPEDVAEVILFCCTRKHSVNIDTLTITPLEQVDTDIQPLAKE